MKFIILVLNLMLSPFDVPEYTANVTALGTLRILDAILTLRIQNKVKFYQAGTSEMFGASKPPQNEKTKFYPRSPYGIAKLYSHWITVITEKPTMYLLATEYCLIMRAL